MNRLYFLIIIVVLCSITSLSAEQDHTGHKSHPHTNQTPQHQNVTLTNEVKSDSHIHESKHDHAAHGEQAHKPAVNGELDHHNKSGLAAAAVPLGILTLLCLITTLVLGLTMRKNPKVLFPWHKRMAIFTLIVAITHGTIIILFH